MLRETCHTESESQSDIFQPLYTFPETIFLMEILSMIFLVFFQDYVKLRNMTGRIQTWLCSAATRRERSKVSTCTSFHKNEQSPVDSLFRKGNRSCTGVHLQCPAVLTANTLPSVPLSESWGTRIIFYG